MVWNDDVGGILTLVITGGQQKYAAYAEKSSRLRLRTLLKSKTCQAASGCMDYDPRLSD